ncbi:MAG: hypothetical protein RLZZ352_807 [Pseudomonadota bacterium]|jgi:hypothetical protein
MLRWFRLFLGISFLLSVDQVKKSASLLIFIALFLGAVGQSAAQLSVSISDNVVVLDDKQRTGSIDLVNLGLDPVEFTVRNIGQEGDSSLIRWAPARVLVEPNRSAKLRVMARPGAKTDAEETLIKLGITSEVKRPPSLVTPKIKEETIDGVAVSIPLTPTLPMFVYFKNKVPESKTLLPHISIGAFVPTPENDRVLGYFPVTKSDKQKSFVGQARIFDKATGQIIDQGRLHVTYEMDTLSLQIRRVTLPSGEVPVQCLQLWNQYPGRGDPVQTICP